MLIAQDSKGISDGDVNVWGIERPVSTSKSQKHLDLELKSAEELEVRITENNLGTERYKIKRLLF